MPEPFRGVVNLDIRDSTPDWAPFSQPVAPPGTPNVVYVVLDDVVFGALSYDPPSIPLGRPPESPPVTALPAGGGGPLSASGRGKTLSIPASRSARSTA